nr:XRE family transcriptional regulator [Acetobacter fallax]
MRGPERVRIAVENGGGYSAVVRRSGISGSSLNDYLKGRVLRIDTALKLAHACNVSPQWLIFGDSPSTPVPSVPAEQWETVDIPDYDVILSAGSGSEAPAHDKRRMVAIPKVMLPPLAAQNTRNLAYVTVRGDSMMPTIDSGDRVLLRTDVSDIRSGSIYAIRIDNSLLIKRLHLKTNGNVSVVSDNPAYTPEELDAASIRQMISDGGHPARILGRVIWRMGEVGAR